MTRWKSLPPGVRVREDPRLPLPAVRHDALPLLDAAGARPKPKDIVLKAKSPFESETQRATYTWLRDFALPRDATIRAVPNGTWLADTEGKGTKRTPQQMGRVARVIEAQRSVGMREGTPDLAVTWEGRAYWIEMKREDGVWSDVTEDQRCEMLNLLRSGCRVGVARSREDAVALLLLWGVPLRAKLPPRPAPLKPPSSRAQRWPLEGAELRAKIIETTDPNLLRAWGHWSRAESAAARRNAKGAGRAANTAAKKESKAAPGKGRRAAADSEPQTQAPRRVMTGGARAIETARHSRQTPNVYSKRRRAQA